MILSIFDFFTYIFFSGLKNFLEFMHILCFQKMNLLPKSFYVMVVIGSLRMVGDGGGCWEGFGRALGGRWEGVGRALGGRWEGVGRALGGRWEGVGRVSRWGRGGEGWDWEFDL